MDLRKSNFLGQNFLILGSNVNFREKAKSIQNAYKMSLALSLGLVLF